MICKHETSIYSAGDRTAHVDVTTIQSHQLSPAPEVPRIRSSRAETTANNTNLYEAIFVLLYIYSWITLRLRTEYQEMLIVHRNSNWEAIIQLHSCFRSLAKHERALAY